MISTADSPMQVSPGSRVIVGMSGGVDSSVSAALLLEKGYRVTGLFMKNWEDDDFDECNAAQDLEDAQSVCDQLGISLKTVNFSYEYWERVFVGFLGELKAGRTPNPDIICNVEIKFREFPQWASKCGADYVATGHYAKITRQNGCLYLSKPKDSKKDQTYFLHGLNADALANFIFPLAEMTKDEVRRKARKFGFKNHDKRGSAGICFVGRRNFRDFISRYLPSRQGSIVNEFGTVVGSHNGAYLYTIGQRTGLGIGGPGGPWYVAKKDIYTNTVTAVQGHDHPLLYSRRSIVGKPNWISHPYELPVRAKAKVRYLGQEMPCQIEQSDQFGTVVNFEKPVRAVTPGQSMVFYMDDVCMGGAVIDGTQP